MSHLNDEELQSIAKGLDEKDIEAILQVEKVWGTVQCNECDFWGRMDGFIEPQDKRFIKFVCPECSSLELVGNPEHKR
jgi:Zn finger protein HypA/HybF involved in hydrogenase expression